jgi:hypothetical protein
VGLRKLVLRAFGVVIQYCGRLEITCSNLEIIYCHKKCEVDHRCGVKKFIAIPINVMYDEGCGDNLIDTSIVRACVFPRSVDHFSVGVFGTNLTDMDCLLTNAEEAIMRVVRMEGTSEGKEHRWQEVKRAVITETPKRPRNETKEVMRSFVNVALWPCKPAKTGGLDDAYCRARRISWQA